MIILKSHINPQIVANLHTAGAFNRSRRIPMRVRQYKLNDGNWQTDITGADPEQWIIKGRYPWVPSTHLQATKYGAMAAELAKAESIRLARARCDINDISDVFGGRTSKINDINYTESGWADGNALTTEWRITLALDSPAAGATAWVPEGTTEMPGEGTTDPPPTTPDIPRPIPPVVQYTMFLILAGTGETLDPSRDITTFGTTVNGQYYSAQTTTSTGAASGGFGRLLIPSNLLGNYFITIWYSTELGTLQEVWRDATDAADDLAVFSTQSDINITRQLGLEIGTAGSWQTVYRSKNQSFNAGDAAGKHIYFQFTGPSGDIN